MFHIKNLLIYLSWGYFCFTAPDVVDNLCNGWYNDCIRWFKLVPHQVNCNFVDVRNSLTRIILCFPGWSMGISLWFFQPSTMYCINSYKIQNRVCSIKVVISQDNFFELATSNKLDRMHNIVIFFPVFIVRGLIWIHNLSFET